MTDKPIPPDPLELREAFSEVPPSISNSHAMTTRQKLWLLLLVILKRARFFAVLAGVWLLVSQWDTVTNYYHRWTHPHTVAGRELPPDREFYCPMDPQVVRSTYEPNGDMPKCPICGMPLSVRPKGQKAALPPGIAGRVQLSPERIQLAGIKTAKVEYQPVDRQAKTVGYVTYDEGRRSQVVSRVEGYVEKLYVDKTFSLVAKGDPLVEIYSPELYSASRELLSASRSEATRELASSARQKLTLLSVSPQEIDGILASGLPATRLVLRSPQSGYVVEKKIMAGSSVEAKMVLLEVADLATVWIEAEVYEKDIPFLAPGQPVEATVEAWPNRTFTGKLALIYPQIDLATRTNRVRIVLDNPDHSLRPGMFATVRIDTPLETIEPWKTAAATTARVMPVGQHGGQSARPAFLVVPERAVIDSGVKKVVYVEREPGLFEGVEVELGPRQGNYYPVLKGLSAGDRVAAAGGFLLDAETRLNPAAASTYFGASGGPQATAASPSAAPAPAARHIHPANPSAAAPEAEAPNPAIEKALNRLSPEDRATALAQRVCPITGAPLGSMGTPIKISLAGQTVFLCCRGCDARAKNNPQQTLKKVEAGRQTP